MWSDGNRRPMAGTADSPHEEGGGRKRAESHRITGMTGDEKSHDSRMIRRMKQMDDAHLCLQRVYAREKALYESSFVQRIKENKEISVGSSSSSAVSPIVMGGGSTTPSLFPSSSPLSVRTTPLVSLDPLPIATSDRERATEESMATGIQNIFNRFRLRDIQPSTADASSSSSSGSTLALRREGVDPSDEKRNREKSLHQSFGLLKVKEDQSPVRSLSRDPKDAKPTAEKKTKKKVSAFEVSSRFMWSATSPVWIHVRMVIEQRRNHFFAGKSHSGKTSLALSIMHLFSDQEGVCMIIGGSNEMTRSALEASFHWVRTQREKEQFLMMQHLDVPVSSSDPIDPIDSKTPHSPTPSSSSSSLEITDSSEGNRRFFTLSEVLDYPRLENPATGCEHKEATIQCIRESFSLPKRFWKRVQLLVFIRCEYMTANDFERLSSLASAIRGHPAPFGGVPILAFGDPTRCTDWKSSCFQSPLWTVVFKTKVHLSTDEDKVTKAYEHSILDNVHNVPEAMRVSGFLADFQSGLRSIETIKPVHTKALLQSIYAFSSSYTSLTPHQAQTCVRIVGTHEEAKHINSTLHRTLDSHPPPLVYIADARCIQLERLSSSSSTGPSTMRSLLSTSSSDRAVPIVKPGTITRVGREHLEEEDKEEDEEQEKKKKKNHTTQMAIYQDPVHSTDPWYQEAYVELTRLCTRVVFEPHLKLKHGARVMLTAPLAAFPHILPGSIGSVVGRSGPFPLVEFHVDQTFISAAAVAKPIQRAVVRFHQWYRRVNSRYAIELVQVPLVLAWAVAEPMVIGLRFQHILLSLSSTKEDSTPTPSVVSDSVHRSLETPSPSLSSSSLIRPALSPLSSTATFEASTSFSPSLETRQEVSASLYHEECETKTPTTTTTTTTTSNLVTRPTRTHNLALFLHRILSHVTHVTQVTWIRPLSAYTRPLKPQVSRNVLQFLQLSNWLSTNKGVK